MKYDFTTIMDRSGRDSIAVDVPFEIPEAKEGFDRIPMWVADMNFPTVPTVQKAMTERIQHPAFGYFRPREEYYQAIIRWQERRHKVSGLKTEHIGYENGVLGGVVSALNVFCSKGDKVLLHSPTYIGFTNALTNNGYEIVLSPLKRDEEGIWRMDFEDMERKLQEHPIHAAIFCSPHNPSGRVWERWEIERAMEIYERNRVYVISDEIWSEHIPTQSVSEDAKMRTVALYAPSKTFNLAGLVGSYHIIYDPWIRERVEKESSLCHYNEMNVLSMYALIGAYQEEGYEWVEELCQVLTGNVEFAYGYIKDHFPGVSLMKPQGTYMLFLDCGEWLREHKMTLQELLDRGMEYGVIWQDGRPFHGETSIRMNLALPRSRVEEAFERLNRYVFRKL